MNDHGTVRGSPEANAFHHPAFSASLGTPLNGSDDATEPVVVEIYHQTATDGMNETLSSASASRGWVEPNGLHWTAPPRLRLSTESPSAPWPLVVHHLNKRCCR